MQKSSTTTNLDHTAVSTVSLSEQVISSQLPIVYAAEYNPSLPLLNLPHVGLDCEKRAKVATKLASKLQLTVDQFHVPFVIDHEFISTNGAHSARYLDELTKNPTIVSDAFGVKALEKIEFGELSRRLVRPMLLATGGTLKCVDLAFKQGWAINLSGGFHHAHYNYGSGFCFYNDLKLAAFYARNNYLSVEQEVLILDLDAHLGDGTCTKMRKDNRIVLMDLFNKDIWPAKNTQLNARINYAVPLPSNTSDQLYLDQLSTHLEKIISNHNIGCIIYNAGHDIYSEDAKGGMKISAEAVFARDQRVFDFAVKHKLPIVLTLSGAYGEHAPELITESLFNVVGSVKK